MKPMTYESRSDNRPTHGHMVGKAHAFESAAGVLMRLVPDRAAGIRAAIREIRDRLDFAVEHEYPQEFIDGLRFVLQLYERVLFQQASGVRG